MILDFGSNLVANRTTAGLENDNEIVKFHTSYLDLDFESERLVGSSMG